MAIKKVELKNRIFGIGFFLVTFSAIWGLDMSVYGQEPTPVQKAEKGKELKSKWHGTAPFCNASERDCKNGYYYWLDNDWGDGEQCSTGNKVLCVKANPNDYDWYWVGTSPFCGATKQDCFDNGDYFVAFGRAGDGEGCTTGKKVLCAKKKK